MSGLPLFQRSPRLIQELPGGEVELPAPPPARSAPAFTLLSMVWTVLPGLAGPLIMALMTRRNGSPIGAYALASLPMMGVSLLAQVGNLFYQRHRYRKEMEARSSGYRQVLQQIRQDLTDQRDEQLRITQSTSPTPSECLARVEQRKARLWERSPADSDFLSLRLGAGTVPFSVAVKTPAGNRMGEQDPLVREAHELAAQFTQVPGVPVCLPLKDVGPSGLVGPRKNVLAVARAIAMQLATTHSPDEVKLAAIFGPGEASEWAWLRWLPHVWMDDHKARLLAADRGGIHRLCLTLYEWMNRRRTQQEMAGGGERSLPQPAVVVLIADPGLLENEPALAALLREGPALGLFPVVLMERREALPKECRGIADVSPGAERLLLTVPRLSEQRFIPDDAPPSVAEALARSAAAIHLQRMSNPDDLPERLSLLDLFGVQRPEELQVVERWQRSEPFKSLAVPIGFGNGRERLLLDLNERAHGPHGLAAGATGSGKSELLQTLVIALAANFHPHEMAFLMVDYKGGGMANAFRDLPHLIGTITNLEGNLSRRALAALNAELKRRQKLLGDAGVNHVDEYMRLRRSGQALQPLPHLLIVVDEFAELKTQQPDFMRELISAVRVGRSLGVHLLLATQKPAGVVDEQIWSNTRFRLCLRVERPQDSQEVLKCPDAANIGLPGRAYLQVGNNERFELFQAGYGGAPYQPEAEPAQSQPVLAEVALDGTRLRLGDAMPMARQTTGITQLQAVTNYIAEAASAAGITALPSPWLAPLPAELALEDLQPAEGWNGTEWREATTWLTPVLGLVDDPDHQQQQPLRVNLAREGHLAIFGAPGYGKTGALQTLITALALTHPPSDVQFYIIDCGSRVLAHFAKMPHVGAVIYAEEGERLGRLFRFLAQELDRRKALLAEAGVSSFTAYRTAGGGHLPAMVLVLDNYSALTEAYPDGESTLTQLAREGGSMGIHIALTATRPNALRLNISSSVTLALTLYLADRTEYSVAVGRTNGLEPDPIPGRGLIKATPPLAVQVALPATGATEWERVAALRELIATMDAAWSGERPRPINTLPEVVPLAEVAPAAEGAPVIGLDVEGLEPFRLNLQEGPLFLVTGAPGGGKSTCLQTAVLSAAATLPPERLRIWMLEAGSGMLAPLAPLPQVAAYATTGEEMEGAMAQIAEALQERRQALEQARAQGGLVYDREFMARFPALLVVLDDLELVRDAAPAGVKEKLEQFIRRERNSGFYLMAAGSAGAFNQYDGLTKALKESPAVLILGTGEQGDLSAWNVRAPAGEAGKALPPGQGYYMRRGRVRRIKIATPNAGEPTLVPWVDQLRRRERVMSDGADSGLSG